MVQITQRVNGLHFNNVRGDIYGGVTAAVVALPLALAFGVSSGAGPIAGLYGAIFVGFFAALFGGTSAQISGPTGPMTVVMATIFTHYTSLDPVAGPALAFTVVIMGGLIQIAFGALRLGQYINLMPLPVVSGFMSGIGVIIILLQTGPLLGHAAQSGPLAAAKTLPDAIANPVSGAVILGLLALAIVYLLPKRIGRVLPSPLVALVVGTLALLVVLRDPQVTVLGDIPTGLPTPYLPTITLALLPGMIKSALVLATLGAIDSLLTSLVADNITHTHHHSNRELIGQGIGNTIAGFFGGLPGAGATMRTVVNVRAGGQTPISGVLHALILLAIVLGLGSFASHIPHAVLAGILIKVGTDIIDWDYLRRMHRSSPAGVLMMLTVLFTTVFVDLITAVAAGVVMASLLLVKRVTDLQLSSIRAFTHPDERSPLTPEEAAIMEAADGKILLYQLGGPMSFGAAKGMVQRLSMIEGYELLVLDVSNVTTIDYTTSRAIEDMIVSAQSLNHDTYLVGARGPVKRVLEKERVLRHLPEGRSYSSLIDALRHAAATLDEQEPAEQPSG